MSGAGSAVRRAVIALDERFMVPALRSGHAAAWVAGRDLLAAPLQLRGAVRHHAARVDDGMVHAVCIGRAKRFATLLQRWLGATTPVTQRATRSLWAPAPLAALDADLVAVEVHRWAAPRFRRAGWVIVPETVRWHADAAAVPPARPSDSLKSDLARVRRGGFELEVAGSPADWAEFHETMVRPHASSRFGTDAWSPSAALRRRFAAEGTLLFVRRGGERLGGFAALPLGRTIWFPLSGLRGGDPLLLADGVMAATYALAFAWAREQGYARIDLGRTTPFCRDGVARVKRKWGFTPARDPLTQLVALRLRPGATALRAALAREPVLVETPEGVGELALDALGPAAAAHAAAARVPVTLPVGERG